MKKVVSIVLLVSLLLTWACLMTACSKPATERITVFVNTSYANSWSDYAKDAGIDVHSLRALSTGEMSSYTPVEVKYSVPQKYSNVKDFCKFFRRCSDYYQLLFEIEYVLKNMPNPIISINITIEEYYFYRSTDNARRYVSFVVVSSGGERIGLFKQDYQTPQHLTRVESIPDDYIYNCNIGTPELPFVEK